MLDLLENFGRWITIAAVVLISISIGVVAGRVIVDALVSLFGYTFAAIATAGLQLLFLWLSFYGYSLLTPADPDSRLRSMMVGTGAGLLAALSSQVTFFLAGAVLMLHFVKLIGAVILDHPLVAFLSAAPFFGLLLFLAIRVDRYEGGA